MCACNSGGKIRIYVYILASIFDQLRNLLWFHTCIWYSHFVVINSDSKKSALALLLRCSTGFGTSAMLHASIVWSHTASHLEFILLANVRDSSSSALITSTVSTADPISVCTSYNATLSILETPRKLRKMHK